MKLHKYLGGIVYEELFFEEINIKFLVHKDLINEDTREMLLNYMTSGIAPLDIHVNTAYDIYCFEPINSEGNPYFDENPNYLWFAL